MISDITNEEETHITEYAWGKTEKDGTEKHNPRKSNHEWPTETNKTRTNDMDHVDERNEKTRQQTGEAQD
jgi:hypothetical protein